MLMIFADIWMSMLSWTVLPVEFFLNSKKNILNHFPYIIQLNVFINFCSWLAELNRVQKVNKNYWPIFFDQNITGAFYLDFGNYWYINFYFSVSLLHIQPSRKFLLKNAPNVARIESDWNEIFIKLLAIWISGKSGTHENNKVCFSVQLVIIL